MFDKLLNIIKNYNKIILVPHKDIDLDALGSSLGLYEILSSKEKEVYINIEEVTHELGVKRALEKIKNLNINILKLEDIKVTPEDLIIVLDCHKREMLQNPDITKLSKNIIIIDHHIESKDIINNILLKIVDYNSSSTSEIIINLTKEKRIQFNSKIADIMLAGITIDTNNFTIRTSSDTHEAAAILNNMGASSKYVQYLLKEDITDYINMQKIIFNTQIIDGKYAVATGLKTEIYEKEQLSKIADSLLTFDNIEASFCIGKINSNIIGISSRSIGNIDVQKIMEKLNGGGNKQDAACMMYNTNIDVAKDKLIKVIKGGNDESNIY